MKSKLIHISDIINSILKNIRTSSDTNMTEIWELWQNSVGETIAKEAKPGAFKDGILIVHVSSSVWIQHLNFLKKDIIMQLNGVLKYEVVKDIRFKIGKIHN
ncbi:MAG: DUF721 domain-containing protein [Desulfamplus sp.]|nr:DUF721 domain-containing protein [Desulfamplus sp.]